MQQANTISCTLYSSCHITLPHALPHCTITYSQTCITTCSLHPQHCPHVLGITDQSAGRPWRAVQHLHRSRPRVILWSHSNNTATAKLKLFSHTHFVIELSEHKPYKLSFSCAVFQCRISTQTRQMPVSVSVSVWMRVSARQIPLDPPPLVSSPNADPPIILAKCPTYILMPGPIVLD